MVRRVAMGQSSPTDNFKQGNPQLEKADLERQHKAAMIKFFLVDAALAVLALGATLFGMGVFGSSPAFLTTPILIALPILLIFFVPGMIFYFVIVFPIHRKLQDAQR